MQQGHDKAVFQKIHLVDRTGSLPEPPIAGKRQPQRMQQYYPVGAVVTYHHNRVVRVPADHFTQCSNCPGEDLLVYALRGEIERAAAELAEARSLNGGDLFSSIAHVKAGWGWGVPKTHALFEATYFAGLRKAGMPEE
jgi:hypothetical protein